MEQKEKMIDKDLMEIRRHYEFITPEIFLDVLNNPDDLPGKQMFVNRIKKQVTDCKYSKEEAYGLISSIKKLLPEDDLYDKCKSEIDKHFNKE